MDKTSRKEPCPNCGKLLSPAVEVCPRCGEDIYEDAPRPRRRNNAVEAEDFLIPTNVPMSAIAACYLGLIAFCLPFIGFLLAFPAVICGIVALRRAKKGASYNAVTGKIRAIIGLVLGSLSILYHVFFTLWAFLAR
jgi:zinc-ribbon domain